jgi:hypothetical protein
MWVLLPSFFVKVTNLVDEILAERGFIPNEQVGSITLDYSKFQLCEVQKYPSPTLPLPRGGGVLHLLAKCCK